LTAAQAEQLPVKAAAAPPARKPPRAPPAESEIEISIEEDADLPDLAELAKRIEQRSR
jgi:hypothetical protein